MRTWLLIILFFCLTKIFGQTNKFHGLVLDSVSHRSIPYCSVYSRDIGVTTADSIGNFEFLNVKDSALKLRVVAVGYFAKDLIIKTSKSELAIYLVPFSADPDKLFIIQNKPVDSTFYSDKTLQNISFGHRDEITFYPSGQKQTTTVDGNLRSWYKNGQLEYQSILITNHRRQETTWYDTGQLQSQGTLNWKHNPKTNAGDWFKNSDWQYWNKDGSTNLSGQ